MKGTKMTTTERLEVERAEIGAQFSGPPEPMADATRIVHEADALVETKERELAEVRRSRDAVNAAWRDAARYDSDAREAADARAVLDGQLIEVSEAMFCAIRRRVTSRPP
jgi:hypothetical protein